MEKQERKQKKILTENRMVTVNKRETSFEGLVSQFENGEDGIYGLITENKNTIFQPKVKITKQDIELIPGMKQLREAISDWETKLATATNREAYIIKHTIIDLQKDQYVLKNSYYQPITMNQLTRSKCYPTLDSKEEMAPDGEVRFSGVSLLDPRTISAILCNYAKLKEDSWENFESDTWYFINDFEAICDEALKDYPLYMRLIECKIDGMSNIDIQETLQFEFGIKHSIEYISSLWRNKIPKIIAEAAQDQWIQWYYLNIEKGQYKRCSRCGEIKLATNRYFSKNKTSKDSYYSICKRCRNLKNKDEEEEEYDFDG